MSIAIGIFALLSIVVAFLLRAEFTGRRRQFLILKPSATLLVIITAAISLLQRDVMLLYSILVLLGLIFSLGGDVALMFETPRWFRLGLISFLLAHIAYIRAFLFYGPLQPKDAISGILIALFAFAVFLYLRPGLGRLQLPVLLYILVISLMLNRAIATLTNSYAAPMQAVFISVGAFLFFVSDLMLAINKFRRPFRLHRLNLIPYFLGQFLIALSAWQW